MRCVLADVVWEVLLQLLTAGFGPTLPLPPPAPDGGYRGISSRCVADCPRWAEDRSSAQEAW
jgi:hypothetical protein